MPESEKASVDPDGHFERKREAYRTEVVAHVVERGVLPDMNDELRGLVSQFPGFKDESEEYEQKDGVWVRKPQKIVKG